MNDRNIVTGKITTIARTAEIAALIGMLIIAAVFFFTVYFIVANGVMRSEERRVGKEC